MSGFIDYIYTHQETQASTGYFSCLPTPEPALAESLRLLAERPLDSFLHRHVLRTLGGLGPGDLRPRLAPLLNAENSGVISALLRELLALGHCRAEALEFLPDGTWDDDAQSTPLPLLRRAKTDDVDLQARWMELFRANLAEHRALPGPEQIGLPPLYAENHATPPVVRLDELYPLLAVSAGQGAPRTPAEETAALAEEALLRRGISAGGEQRHEASLSPVALLKPWRLDLRVACGRNKYTLTGRANT